MVVHEEHRPHPGRIWLKTSRPVTLTATMSPILVGTALAAYDGYFKLGIFLLTLGSCLFLQIGTNFFNEYFDHRYGLDSLESLGASTVIFRGELTSRQVLAGGVSCFVLAALLGLGLVWILGPTILLFGVVGIGVAYFYSAWPFKLASRGLGDIMVFLTMGLLMTWGAYYVQIQRWSWPVLAASIPVGFLVTAILNMNNVRDYQEDLAVQKRTLPVRFGLLFGQRLHAFLVLGSYLALSLGVLGGLLPPLSLITWLTFPLAFTNVRSVTQAHERKPFIVGTKRTALLHLQFGAVLAGTIVIATLIKIVR